MVVGADVKLELGVVYYGLQGPKGLFVPDQPYRVLREATHQECVASSLEMGGDPNRLAIARPCLFYYEIATD